MKKLATVIAASFILFSCSESVDSVDKSLEVNTNAAEAPQNVVSTQSSTDSNINLNSADNNSASADMNSTPANINSTPQSNQNISLPQANVSNPSLKPAVATTSAKGLNPAHGQPNHRCDIAVGEPLSTPIKQAPVQNITTPTATQNAPQVITTPTPTLPKAAGAAAGVKLNPPHGEPGHDCAIQVGAPLKN